MPAPADELPIEDILTVKHDVIPLDRADVFQQGCIDSIGDRFLYAVTLGRETLDLMASVPHMKRATRRAEVYARSEVEAILTAPRQPRDRVLLMTVYGCGLRISEATQLKTSDIDRARMQLRVRDDKGAKGRVLPLSERLLTKT